MFKKYILKVNSYLNYLQLKVALSLFLLLSLPYTSLAQTVENVKATVKQDVIIITYDLLANADQTFNVNLHYSRDSFENPLILVTGDVGPDVKAGKGKRIEWLAKNELQEFNGSLIFEVRAILPQAAHDPLKFVSFNIGTIKSGKAYGIQWEGGKNDESINLLLLENGQEIAKIESTNNNSQYYRWKIPKGNKSSNYQIKLEGESGSIASSQFKIKKGTPVILIAGAALIVGGAVAAVMMLGADDNLPANNDLPVAPDPN